ncbi:MAG TPA: nuclear transport factor 2 family protein [Pyrinomonadaceae bacterium]|jgi:hypothetical protein
MRKLALLIVMTGVAALIVWLPVRAQNAEEMAVRETIENYFRGHATGNGEYFKKAFHPEARLFWIRDRQVALRTSADYINGASGKPAPDEARRKRRIESIDITGNAAIVKVALDYPDAHIIDYMSMLKVDGAWKIINKTFHVNRKS